MASTPGLAVKMTSPVHLLTPQQKLFVENVIKGNPPEVAARIAGYSNPRVQATQVLKTGAVQNALRYLYKKHEKAADMDRKRVMDGFLESIEMARLQADAGNMVAGWREIAKMCGYYAPEVKKIEVNITAQRVIGQMESLSDDDLLKMVEESAQIIEGEASRVLEELQAARSEDEEGGNPGKTLHREGRQADDGDFGAGDAGYDDAGREKDAEVAAGTHGASKAA